MSGEIYNAKVESHHTVISNLQREVIQLRTELERQRSCIRSTSIGDAFNEIYNGNVNETFELEIRSGMLQKYPRRKPQHMCTL